MISKYIRLINEFFTGLVLLCIDRAREKDFTISYQDELNNRLAIHRALTGNNMKADEVIILDALKIYNKSKAFSLSDKELEAMFKKYAQGKLSGRGLK